MDTRSIIAEHHPFVKEIARAMRKRCGVHAGDAVVVATSGGADSVALLRAAALLAPRRKWRLSLTVAHVQHHLRDDAEADAAFVQRLAADLGLPFVRRDIHPGGRDGNLEGNARQARYMALADIAHEAGASMIATAHHADDQLETLLMRLLRGAGPTGLRGIAWRRGLGEGKAGVIRPMLSVSRESARGFLTAVEQPWREDHTNDDMSRTRARLRHEVLPVLHALQPAAAQRAVDFADHMRDVARLIEHEVDSLLDQHGTSSLPREVARNAPRIVIDAALRRMLIDAGAPSDQLGRKNVGAIVRAVRDRKGGTRSFDVAGGVKAAVTAEGVTVKGRSGPSAPTR